MKRWVATGILFAIAVLAFAAVWVVTDRRNVIAAREESLLSHARLIAAHADAALGDAEKIVLAIEDQVAAWDQNDRRIGEDINQRLKKLIQGSPHISSAWVLNTEATNIVDNWSYPARPVRGAERAYFLRHKQGRKEPLVIADPQPGAITGRYRFTYSAPQHTADGTLKSIIVVGIYSDYFSDLYAQTTRSAGARAGFFDGTGSVLAQQNTRSGLHDAEIAKLIVPLTGPDGSTVAMLDLKDTKYLVAKASSKSHPSLFAVVSQPIDLLLAEWQTRAVIIFAAAGLMCLAFGWIVRDGVRIERARGDAAMKDLAMREVHHRVKNSLQLISSMVQLRSRRQDSPAVKEVLQNVVQQIQAVGQIHDLLQNAARLDSIEMHTLIESLCASLRASWHGKLDCEWRDQVRLDPQKGSVLAVVINELLTNAVKHATGNVRLKSEVRQGTLVLTVSNDGPPLPSNFKLHDPTSFGLRAALMLSTQIGATLQAIEDAPSGVTFRLSLPLKT